MRKIDCLDLCKCDIDNVQKWIKESNLNVAVPIVSVDGAEWEIADDWDGNKKRCDFCEKDEFPITQKKEWKMKSYTNFSDGEMVVKINDLIKYLDKMEQDYKDINEHNCYVRRIIFDIKNKLQSKGDLTK